MAVHAAKELGIPVGIVAPKSVLPTWTRVCAEEGLEPVFITNYEKLSRGNTPWILRDGTKFLWSFQGIIIFDEVHRCRATRSLNSRMLIEAWKSQHIRCLCLSATAAQNPLEMRALGYVLNLNRGYDFWVWAMRLGIKKNRFGGYSWTGTDESIANIHRQIFPARGVRIRIKDLGDAFPSNEIIPELVEVGTVETLADYKAALAELQRLKEQEKVDYPSVFTAQLRARQKLEILKIPVFIERTNDLIEEGKSVVIFVNFTATLEQLAAELQTTCTIHGTQTAEERETNIQNFKNDRERICIANIQSGGVGLSLSDHIGEHPRCSIISPSYSAVDVRQATGRIYRADSKTACLQWIFLAAGIEERIYKSVKAKLDRIEILNDGDLNGG